jgi:plasmid segregation protein ParM
MNSMERRIRRNLGPIRVGVRHNPLRGHEGPRGILDSGSPGTSPLFGRTDFKVVVGQPISMHTPTEKSKMKKMLEKTHAITVNGDYKQITILRAEVAAEGGAAFWSNPQKGKVRILDFGSGTVNAATLIEGRYIDRDSFTLKFGLNTIRSQDLTEMGRYVANECLKKWNEQDDVYCVGGGAELMIDHLHEYFPNVKPLQPKVGGGLNTKVLPPIFANAVGFYKIGNKVFQ